MKTVTLPLTGRCQCGALAYSAAQAPIMLYACHCTDCQTFGGSAFRVGVVADLGSVIFQTGTPKLYIKTAESGNKRAQGFCPDCGTSLFSTTADDVEPRPYRLRHGVINQRGQLVPKGQIWTRSAQSWVYDLDKIAKTETQ